MSTKKLTVSVGMLPPSVLTKSQRRKFGPKVYIEHGDTFRIVATVRHDDECRNGHNSFSITAEIHQKGRNGQWYGHSGGCCHEDVAKHFPDLAPLIKWHLMGTDSPIHYIENTIYHASNRDHRGLLKGEKKQLRNGKTGIPVWERVVTNEKGDAVDVGSRSWIDSEECPTEKLSASYQPVWIVGEGKKRNFEYARSSAVWPEATDEQLSANPEDLKRVLIERLPALMMDFKKAVESLGMVY